jgi:hypothetical protein
MNIEDIYHSASEGHRKGKRDVKLSRKYLESNDNRLDASEPFWQTLGKDVNPNDLVERAAYIATKTTFMDRWAAAHSMEMVAAAFEQHARKVDEQKAAIEEGGPLMRPVIVQNDENINQNLVAAYGDDLTEENIDKLAHSTIHGHMIREEECEPIILLRAALAWKLENPQ